MKSPQYKAFTYSLIGLILIVFILSVQNCASVPVDKKLHIACGMFAGSWGTWVGNVYTDIPEKSALIGLGISALAGLGKETIDFGTGGEMDVKDFGASLSGGLIGAGLVYAGMKIFKKRRGYLNFGGNGLIIKFKI
jgi:hypothetical protein